MAVAVDFPEANLTLTGPAGPQDPDVYALRCRRLDGSVVTCWQLSAADVEAIIASDGKVWVSVWGQSMPPMMVTGLKGEVV